MCSSNYYLLRTGSRIETINIPMLIVNILITLNHSSVMSPIFLLIITDSLNILNIVF